MAFKKGDRVTWHEAGSDDARYGVVDSVRKTRRLTATADGGRRSVNGPFEAFQHSDKPLPTDTVKTAMDQYSIKGYRSIMGTDGYAFNATIYKGTRRIIEVLNGGYGAPNEYYTKTQCSPETLKTFFDDALDWCKTFGFPDPSDAADLWVDWYVHSRAYGVTGEAYIGDLAESIAKIDAARKGEETHGTE